MRTLTAFLLGALGPGCALPENPCSVRPVGRQILGLDFEDCGFYGPFRDRAVGAECVSRELAAQRAFLYIEQVQTPETTHTYGTAHRDGEVLFLYGDTREPGVVTAIACVEPRFSTEEQQIVCQGGGANYTVCSPERPGDGLPEPWAPVQID